MCEWQRFMLLGPTLNKFVYYQSYHTFLEIDHEIIATAILPTADSRRVVVSYKQKHQISFLPENIKILSLIIMFATLFCHYVCNIVMELWTSLHKVTKM